MHSSPSLDLPLFGVGGMIGWIFEGEFSATYCFVPEDCLLFQDEGLELDELNYFRSGWAERNFRANDGGAGHYLFPNILKPLTGPRERSVIQFLHRTETLYALAGVPPTPCRPRFNIV